MTVVLVKRGNLDALTDILRGKRVRRYRQKTAQPRRVPGAEPSLAALHRDQPCGHLDFRLPASRL